MSNIIRVEINPLLLKWASERIGIGTQVLSKRIPQLKAWEKREKKPTLKQIERFAKTVHVPVGYLFLKEPPIEKIPIPDYRTIGNEYLHHPSPDLLETIYLCQQRQEWYHEYAHSIGEAACNFVGSAKLNEDIKTVAARIRNAIGFKIEARQKMRTWEEALRRFIEQTDNTGILVMISGVVGNNNRRKLDPTEFRGFVLSDDLAPLVFINGADTKSAQMFTLAHELAHIWIGESGLSDINPIVSPSNQIETWCNQVAAEILVPLESLQNEFRETKDLANEVDRLARFFKVSTLVILRRIHDAGHMTNEELLGTYQNELTRLKKMPRGSGGDFYLTQAARVSKRFARALIISTLEGQTLHRDAFRLLGFSKFATFQQLGRNLGVA